MFEAPAVLWAAGALQSGKGEQRVMQPREFFYASAETLAAAYAAGTADPREVTESLLARIHDHNAKLNAFIDVYYDEARAEADGAARRLRANSTLSPLDGVPVAVKDLADIEGRRAAGGSAALTDRISPVTATVVRRLRSAGMVVLGKTHMVEFACGGWGTNVELGTPWNPWDLDVHRVPGGSSSGSAVAVAAGLATAAIGSDTGGSVRIPAALCGLTGLKTTLGRVSNSGTLPLAKSFDTLGPLTRTARDACRVYEIIRGPDPGDPQTLGVVLDDPFAGIDRGVAGMRLGAMPEAERQGIDPVVLEAYDSALEIFRSLGAVVTEVKLPEAFDTVRPRCGTMIMAEGYAETRCWVDRDDLPLDPNVRARLLSGRDTPIAEYLGLVDDRRRTQAAWNASLEGVEALLTPTTPIPALRVTDVDESAFTLARFTRAGNYLDWCAVSLPCGFSDTRLPLSLQIQGRSFHEARVLRIAASFQSATSYHLQHPEL